MSFISSLLSKVGKAQGATLGEDLIDIVAVIASIFGGVVTLYALYLAYAMATASDANKRAEAKKRVINSVAIVLIIIALVGLLRVVGAKGNNVIPQGDWVITYEGSGPSYTVKVAIAPGIKVENAEDMQEISKNLAEATWTIVEGEGTASNQSGWTFDSGKKTGAEVKITKATDAKRESVTVNCKVGSDIVKITVP